MHILSKRIEKAMYSFMSDGGDSQQFLGIQVHGPHLRNTARDKYRSGIPHVHSM